VSRRCPVCGDRYTEKRRGKSVTIPPEYDDCHTSVQLATGETVGRWYLHE